MDGKFPAECCHPFMLRRAQHERVTAFREVIFDGILKPLLLLRSVSQKLNRAQYISSRKRETVKRCHSIIQSRKANGTISR